MVTGAFALPNVWPFQVIVVGVKTPGTIGAPEVLVLDCDTRKRPPTTTTATTTATTLHRSSELIPPPPDPRVLARVMALFASRLARRCWRAERRLVGGALLPEEGRPAGRLDVMPSSLCGMDWPVRLALRPRPDQGWEYAGRPIGRLRIGGLAKRRRTHTRCRPPCSGRSERTGTSL